MSSAKRVRAYRLRKEAEKKVKMDKNFESLCTNSELFSEKSSGNQFEGDSDCGSVHDFESEAE